MTLPKIYAHIAPDGKLLTARDVPPVSRQTMGGRVYDYVPAAWNMSNEPDFKFPEADRAVVCKVLTLDIGVEVPEQDLNHYHVFHSNAVLKGVQQFWGIWGWKYLEG